MVVMCDERNISPRLQSKEFHMSMMLAMQCVEELLDVLDGEYGQDTEEAEKVVAYARECLDEWQGPEVED
jgi:hypothetical protein